MTDLPAALANLDAVLPVRALAALVRPDAPRWAYTVLAADLAGPWRSEPGLSDEALDRGLPARPAGPQQLFAGTKLTRVGTDVVEEPTYRDGPWLPGQAAVPPLRPLLRRAAEEDALLALVEHLDALAGVDVPPTEPDAPEGWTVPAWPVMRTILSGDEAPPLRWEPPVQRSGGRPELAALRPNTERHPRLAAVPRSAPPVQRHGLAGGLLATDARLLALDALVAHADAQDAPVAADDVLALARWLVGPDRAVPTGDARRSPEAFRVEYAAPGVRQAEVVLASTRPETLLELVTHRETAFSAG